MKKSLSKGTIFIYGVVFSLCLMLLSHTAVFGAEKKIILKKYPEFKIGFTTANFAKAMPPTAANIKKMLDFAARQGFAFIEIRDPEARLTLDECKDLAAYSKKKNVEIVYAMNTGLMDPNFWEVFSRGLANAGVFHGPRVVRTGANGLEMLKADKLYWTAEDFAKLVENANRAANTAKMFGIQFLVENAREGLKGDGITTFGTIEFFGKKGVNENVGLQLDVANFFCTSRVPSEPDQVKSFVADHAARIGYTHLKTSKANKPQAVLDGNQLAFEEFFAQLKKNRKNYIAMELDPAAVLADVYANHVKSIEYLKKNY